MEVTRWEDFEHEQRTRINLTLGSWLLDADDSHSLKPTKYTLVEYFSECGRECGTLDFSDSRTDEAKIRNINSMKNALRSKPDRVRQRSPPCGPLFVSADVTSK